MNETIQIHRFHIDNDNNYILGRLTVFSNEKVIYSCYTMEPKKEAIEKGVYPITYNYSPKFKRDLYLVRDTEPRNGIRLHQGNTSADSSGCILVGTYFMNNRIEESFSALQRLHKVLNRQDSTLVIYGI